ncbi:MAG: hypothetical protein M1829_005051 [Trizodia sp. TS-e1964]|nr:MAG: hypothetical protein M1829_005051 [Trizodia sp. TS-e1964]
MFPKDYDFLFVKNGIDQRSSFLKSRSGHRRRSSASQIALAEQRARRRSTTQEISESKRDANISENDVLITSKPPTAETSLVAADTSLETTLPPITAPFSEIIPSTSPEQIKRPDDPINALSNSMATLKLVPRTIKFGRGRGKGGLSNY